VGFSLSLSLSSLYPVFSVSNCLCLVKVKVNTDSAAAGNGSRYRADCVESLLVPRDQARDTYPGSRPHPRHTDTALGRTEGQGKLAGKLARGSKRSTGRSVKKKKKNQSVGDSDSDSDDGHSHSQSATHRSVICPNPRLRPRSITPSVSSEPSCSVVSVDIATPLLMLRHLM
jgi:hypothetical protein